MMETTTQPILTMVETTLPKSKKEVERTMSTRMDKLLAAQERERQKLHKAQMEEKRIKKQIDELQRRERTHRLCTRGAYLEKLLQEPELLSDEEVFRFLDYAINTPYAKKALENLLVTKHQEAATAEKNDAGEPTE